MPRPTDAALALQFRHRAYCAAVAASGRRTASPRNNFRYAPEREQEKEQWFGA